MTDTNAELIAELIAADHEQARRSPDHLIAALGDMFAAVETAADGSSYVRLYLSPYSDTIDGRWIAVDLHAGDAAQITAELGKALTDVLFDRAARGRTEVENIAGAVLDADIPNRRN